MPSLLYTYLVNQILAPFYASLIILTSILFLGKLIPILDIILDYNIAPDDFIRLYAYFAPQLLLFALPMASMMGVILGTTHINNENELMVLRASGRCARSEPHPRGIGSQVRGAGSNHGTAGPG